MYFPYLGNTLSPNWNSSATGMFFGIRPTTTKAHFIRSVIEGVAFDCNSNVKIAKEAGAKIDKFTLNGGPTKSKFWNQITSDVTGLPLDLPDVGKSEETGFPPEAAPLGDAILAAVGAGFYSNPLESLKDIVKVISASNKIALKKVDQLYSSIISAGTYIAPSIKVAEAAKAIENTQRDLNIAFFNELSKLFNTLKIDTNDVIDAASTKWNFIPFKPGLVGGHCIGVDPFYLTHVAKKNNFYPKVILAGRETNDKMHEHIGFSLINDMLDRKLNLVDSSILILGATFKQNCPDLRNSKALEFADYLAQLGPRVTVHDPIASIVELKETISSLKSEARKKIHLNVLSRIDSLLKYDAIVLAVSHDSFIKYSETLADQRFNSKIIYDLQGFLPKKLATWRL